MFEWPIGCYRGLRESTGVVTKTDCGGLTELFGDSRGLLGCNRGLPGVPEAYRGVTGAQGGFLICEYCQGEIWESGELAKHMARADPRAEDPTTRLQIRILSLASQLSALPRPLILLFGENKAWKVR